MTLGEVRARKRLEAERVRISHDLLQNNFGGILLPGWRDDRLSSLDVVLRALRGDAESRTTVQDALSVWTTRVFPALDSIVRSISTTYGFVTTPVWDEEVSKIRSADAMIRRILGGDGTGDQESLEDRTRAFWEACDTVRTFLGDLRSRSSEFFRRWDSKVMSDESAG